MCLFFCGLFTPCASLSPRQSGAGLFSLLKGAENMEQKYACPGIGIPLRGEELCRIGKTERARKAAPACLPGQIKDGQSGLERSGNG